jgi:hypothetical protein
MRIADQRLAAPAPELEGGEPDVRRDDAGDDQRPDLVVLGHQRQAAHQQPENGAGDQVNRLDWTAIEHARAGPGHGKGGKEQCVGNIDADEVGH